MEDGQQNSQSPLVLSPREPFVVTTQKSSHITREQLFAMVGAVLITGAAVSTGMWKWGEAKVVPIAVYIPPVVPVEQIVEPSTANPYTQLRLQARAALVYDVREERFLYAQQADTPLPLASLTKLMTSLLAVESLDTNAHIAVTQNAIDTEGDSGLFANERWRIRDLVSFTMMTSSNDGADALAAAVGGAWQTTPETVGEYGKVESFVKKMNLRASELGLANMRFHNATGLDEPNGDMGGVGSATDVAKLVTYIWEHEPTAIAHTDELYRTYRSTDGYVHEAKNTNEDVYKVPGLIASKTGFTDKAGGNLAVLYNAGLDHPIIVVVLGSTKDGRFTDVDALVNATYDYVETGWYQFDVAGSTDRG